MASPARTEINESNADEFTRKAAIAGSRGLLVFATSSLISCFSLLTVFRYLFPTGTKANKHEMLACERPHRFSKHTLITKVWTTSHAIFATCMFTTYFLSSTTSIYAMMVFAGSAWAITTWAPFTLISMDVSTTDSSIDISEEENGAGIMIGLLNVSICLPQILAAFVSGFVFWWLGNENSGTSIVCLLNFGGVAAALAACLCAGIHSRENQELEVSQGWE